MSVRIQDRNHVTEKSSINKIPYFLQIEIGFLAGAKSAGVLTSVNKEFQNTFESPCLWKLFCINKWGTNRLNSWIYQNDWNSLYFDDNGWLPRKSTKIPKFQTKKMNQTGSYQNYTDMRLKNGHIYTICEGANSDTTCYVKKIDSKNSDVNICQTIEAKYINCLDMYNNLYACGDNAGRIYVYGNDDVHLLTYQCPSDLEMIGMYGIGMGHEINDLRLCDRNSIVAIRTASRYPAGVSILDIETKKSRIIKPMDTNYWIHALDIDGEHRNLHDLYFVGENIHSGIFSVIRMDLRDKKSIVADVPLTRRMLWPLRVSGNYVFVNSVFAPYDFCGKVRQFDIRNFDTKLLKQESKSGEFQPATTEINGSFLHHTHDEKIQDFRIRGNFMYSLTQSRQSLDLWRFNIHKAEKPVLLYKVDFLDASNDTNAPKIIQIEEGGWYCSYGSKLCWGHISR